MKSLVRRKSLMCNVLNLKLFWKSKWDHIPQYELLHPYQKCCFEKWWKNIPFISSFAVRHVPALQDGHERHRGVSRKRHFGLVSRKRRSMYGSWTLISEHAFLKVNTIFTFQTCISKAWCTMMFHAKSHPCKAWKFQQGQNVVTWNTTMPFVSIL